MISKLRLKKKSTGHSSTFEEEHVPVEHRWLGIDKRTIPLALTVLAAMLVFMFGIPAISDAVKWNDTVRAGDVIDLGQGITFVPPVGWELTSGIRQSTEPISGLGPDGDASISNAGVSVSVERSEFEGTPKELLEQVNRLRTKSNATPDRAFKVTGTPKSVTTKSGITGVSEAYTSLSGEGRILAFTVDGKEKSNGITITIDAADQAYAHRSDEINALIDSLTVKEPRE